MGITDCVTATGMSTVTSVSRPSNPRIRVPSQARIAKNPNTAVSRMMSRAKRPDRSSEFARPGKPIWAFFSAANALP